MQRARWMVPVVALCLMPAAVIADDARTAVEGIAQADLVALSMPAYRQAAVSATRWRPTMPNYDIAYAGDALHPIETLDFRDSGALARVSKVRQLSLLTLAELGKTRLFFGVNKEGLFGLHLCALPQPGDERSVELARMPYLKNPVRQAFAN